VLLAVLAYGCGERRDPVTVGMPASEEAICAAIVQARDAWHTAHDETTALRRDRAFAKVRPARTAAFKVALGTTRTVTDWRGSVQEVSSESAFFKLPATLTVKL